MHWISLGEIPMWYNNVYTTVLQWHWHEKLMYYVKVHQDGLLGSLCAFTASSQAVNGLSLLTDCCNFVHKKHLICERSWPRKLLSSLEAGIKFLVVRLNIDPNPMAITVHTKQMTLYGILKSGVGREIRSNSVWSFSEIPDLKQQSLLSISFVSSIQAN